MKCLKILLLGIFFLVLGACGRSAPVIRQSFDPAVYIVQTGDTVYSIAWRYAQDFRDVIRWNKLADPYIIRPGQKLIVRSPETGTVAANDTPQPSSSESESQTNTSAKTRPLKKAQRIGVTKAATQKTIASNSPSPPQKRGWTWPVKGTLLTRFANNTLDRQGIDIQGTAGGAVLASRAGKVVYSGPGMLSYGRLVIIKHSETFLSAYAHNSRLLVEEGEMVRSGQRIAQVGTSNRGVTKLHFEIRKNGKPVNPLKYLPRH